MQNLKSLITVLATKTTLNEKQISNILTLLNKGGTIPFIARYRKELTGNADDEQLRLFYDVYMGVKRLLGNRSQVNVIVY